mmetsp:Transcript_10750/g.31721  ORF Transcript_10750/g.31721 Transcript_10750/m.31721 type:complete len:282 (-) Transcript_10750:113-958(-)
MRSASSRISIEASFKRGARFEDAKSARRPGVATTKCALRNASACSGRDDAPAPPATRIAVSVPPRNARFTAASTCFASSRVGANATATEDSLLKRATAGSTYANVFPDPVGATARTSKPANAAGQAWRCTAVNVASFSFAPARRQSGCGSLASPHFTSSSRGAGHCAAAPLTTTPRAFLLSFVASSTLPGPLHKLETTWSGALSGCAERWMRGARARALASSFAARFARFSICLRIFFFLFGGPMRSSAGMGRVSGAIKRWTRFFLPMVLVVVVLLHCSPS